MKSRKALPVIIMISLYLASIIHVVQVHKNNNANDINPSGYISDTNLTVSNETINFGVFSNYSKSIKLYFKSCNESYNWTTRSKTQLSNRFSHLGEKYFSLERLKLHKWYNSSIYISSSDLVILPIFLVLGYRGYCGDLNDFKFNKPNKMFQKMVTQFFDELLSFIESNHAYKNKKYFLMAHEWFVCSHKRFFWNKVYTKFAREQNLIIGHYQKQSKCFSNVSYTNKIVVTPYTIPFQYKQYEMYDNIAFNIKQFYKKKYLLFFMGSACKPWIHNSYLLRLLALEYMSAFNKVSEMNQHFGAITDFGECQIKMELKTGFVKLCDENSTYMPCGLTSNNKLLNKDNSLYRYGLLNSRYNLMIRGDTPTSGKFFDAIAFGLINILIGITKDNMHKYLPFTDIIPYENFVFFISPEDFTDNGVNLIYDILYNTSDEQISYMLSNLTYYKKYVLWDHKESLVIDNILYEANRL